jgi:hypothetical protein
MRIPIKTAIKKAIEAHHLASGAARALALCGAERTEILKARIERAQAYLRLLDLRLAQASGITEVGRG